MSHKAEIFFTLCLAVLVFSPSPAGFLSRATLAVPPYWLHLISESTLDNFVFGAHW